MRHILLAAIIFMSCKDDPALNGNYKISLSFMSEDFAKSYSTYYILINKEEKNAGFYEINLSYHGTPDSVTCLEYIHENDNEVVNNTGATVYSFVSKDTNIIKNSKNQFESFPYSHSFSYLIAKKQFIINDKKYEVFKFREHNGGSQEHTDTYSYYLKTFGVILIQGRNSNDFFYLNKIDLNNTEIRNEILLQLPKLIMDDTTFCTRIKRHKE